MNKLIAALALALAATQAHAYVDICAMKNSQSEAQQCYQYGANGGMLRMKENYKRILNSPRVSDSEKRELQNNQKKWEKAVDSKCDDNVCYYRAIGSRNDEIEQFMRSRGLQPM
ncbi:Uncharacterized protein conserved in bacteria [Burkholderia pseudomallei]|uniref:lysozyme inhibitor LprI family protein n=1 Tax=Burkholderia pseudomallei TaxID=28450 RepID=UPI000F0919A9|nr:lysozyme inhibitor LprI family protein [Burkholderia pseudomallei]CAJ3295181.1 Uncharacterized protein conserved in bacteria [Burkholderia pseudomallei]CAJ6241961.1 Uncharacterized protein conserved in bacteria [Burkholderia pseudomallei]VCG63143.1 Uncharacterized protein conserved in bacteria [Burkholderia pseudomallei]VCG98478.1 Uncharacterized protein conserved in bacteria [Burkholderia pseudomallei]VCH00286.1 Uncharacterized protein conserved in bacteria [Burkholderia pseudomallei]